MIFLHLGAFVNMLSTMNVDSTREMCRGYSAPALNHHKMESLLQASAG